MTQNVLRSLFCVWEFSSENVTSSQSLQGFSWTFALNKELLGNRVMNDCENCEEEATNEDEFCPTQADVEELKRKLKAPDRGKLERVLEKINASIREKEAKFRALQSSRSQGMSSNSHEYKDRDSLMTELRGFKAEREKEIEVRKKIDQELRGVNSVVQQKNDACAKLQAGLRYKTETKADEAIRRLEHQMRVQQLKLREEKRLVTEIDALKRSKKTIHDFDAMKHEISQLREKQISLRTQRDNCMRTIAGLKSKEEEIKNALDEQRHKNVEAKQQQRGYNTEKNALKKEIDELYTHKRTLIAEFNKEKEEHSSLLKDIRLQERQIRREAEAMKRIEQRHKQKKLHGVVGEQDFVDAEHERMLNLCDSLIKYLEGLNVTTKAEDSEIFHEPQPHLTEKDSNFTGGTFLKKKTDDDLEAMYGGASKKTGRRGSKKGRRSTQKDVSKVVAKKLVLHPLVLDQFLSLTISPPSTAAEVPKVLELLIEKKANLNAVIHILVPLSRSMSSGSSTASSVENFPSLPSQQETLSSLDSVEVEDESQQGNVDNNLEHSENSTDLIDKQQQQQQQQQQQMQQQQNESINISENCVKNGDLQSNEENFSQTARDNIVKSNYIQNTDCQNNIEHNIYSQDNGNSENGEFDPECHSSVLDLEEHGGQHDGIVIPRELLTPKVVDTNSSIKCPS